MILKNFYDSQLAHASYLIGCPAAGKAVVIDPNRDVEQYLAAAEAEGLQIVSVTETHIHADYVSGARELASRTGATLYLSDEGTEEWKYAFAGEPNVRLVRHGDTLAVGSLRLDVVHTPGHTPEHVSFVLTDDSESSEPCCAFTGDFVFVGDVGRPDLLERAAGYAGTMEAGARELFRSLRRFRHYPATMLIWPAHGAGSACGKSLGGVATSALGRELKTNWALQIDDEDRFVQAVLAGQPEPPAYFKEMKRINKNGPAPLGGTQTPSRIAGQTALAIARQKALILDVRSSFESAAGTLPGAINIPLGKTFVTWAGSVLPFGESIYLLANHANEAVKAKEALGLIGYDSVPAWMGRDVLTAYVAEGNALQRLPSISPDEDISDATILDVRGANDRIKGWIEGSVHIPLGDLFAQASRLPIDRPIVVHCASGARSSVAATILKRLGFTRVSNLAGGYAAYKRSREQSARLGELAPA